VLGRRQPRRRRRRPRRPPTRRKASPGRHSAAGARRPPPLQQRPVASDALLPGWPLRRRGRIGGLGCVPGGEEGRGPPAAAAAWPCQRRAARRAGRRGPRRRYSFPGGAAEAREQDAARAARRCATTLEGNATAARSGYGMFVCVCVCGYGKTRAATRSGIGPTCCRASVAKTEKLKSCSSLPLSSQHSPSSTGAFYPFG
jgi:hypothetical protein